MYTPTIRPASDAPLMFFSNLVSLWRFPFEASLKQARIYTKSTPDFLTLCQSILSPCAYETSIPVDITYPLNLASCVKLPYSKGMLRIEWRMITIKIANSPIIENATLNLFFFILRIDLRLNELHFRFQYFLILERRPSRFLVDFLRLRLDELFCPCLILILVNPDIVSDYVSKLYR